MPSGLHQIRKLKIFGVILALSFAFISAHPAFALEPTYITDGSPIKHGVNLELSVAPTLQVVIPASTVSLNLTPNPDPSKSVFASENLTVSVATNNPTGYSLILKADSTNLTNTVADRNGDYSVLSTLTDLEGGYTEETFTVNRWGYRNTNTLLNNTTTAAIPGNYNAFTTSSEILSSKLPTNLDQTSLDFAAKVDITQPAGTYELALNFEAVTNVIPGVVTINYEPNGADNPDAMEKQQFEVVSPENLIPNSYTKENYVFIGWNTAKDGSGTSYNNNQLYTIPEGTTETSNIDLTLYAQWALAMQAVTTAQCTETPTKVADSRDATVYFMARLEDGNCWMLNNLRLGEKADTYNLTVTDTDTNGDFTFDGKDADGIMPYGTNNGFNYTYDANAYYCTDAYGCYYNWYTATAGSGASATTSGNVGYSICPKGWTLPTGSSGGQLETLVAAYNNNAATVLVSPTTLTENSTGQKPGFLLGGGYNYNGVANVGVRGYYWTRTSNSGQYSYSLSLSSSTVYPSNYTHDKYLGLSVRCLLNTQTISDITYMQDVTPTIAANTPVGMEATLKDNRDQEEYLIGKLADGRLWMLDNLRLGSSNTILLTPENTNIASDWTLPAGTTSGFTVYDSAKINVAYKNDTTTSYGNGSGKVGVYYNYCAASAGTYCYAEGAGTGNASYDICPKNWRMPTGGSSGEYQALYTAYSSNATNFRAALSTPLSGYFTNGTAGSQDNYGYFWSSTRGSGNSMYYLAVNSSNVKPTEGLERYRGFSIRCIINL